MYAISGEFTSGTRPADVRAVERMADAMADHGSGDRGRWAKDWVALAHRSLGDGPCEPATQPIADESLGLVAAFDGRIYNQAELRDELSETFTFHSTSESEVVLKSYAKWGEDFARHLNGVFAIALFDERHNKAILVRDRLGIKPLYLTQFDDALRFASTLPGLLAGGGVDTSLDPVALHHYLSWHSTVPSPRTLLEGIKNLPPATIRVIEEDGRSRDREYWSVEYERQPEHAGWSSEDWEYAIERSLRSAVNRGLAGDVPVGILLSGGLDSSLLVALASEGNQGPLETFSIGFESVGGESGDEFKFSDRIADHFGTSHRRIRITDHQLAEAIPHAVAAMSEPMASHDATAFYLLSQAVSQHTRSVLTGQGADEVFAGYSYHQPVADLSREDALDVFNESFRDRTHEQIVEAVKPGLRSPNDASYAVLQDHMESPGAATALDAVLRLDTHLLMVDDPVKRVDNMTRAWGLEARVPFLDYELVELAAHCPPEPKTMHGGKGVLKQIGTRMLPSDVVDRQKGYFPVPGLRQLDGEVLSLVQDVLRSTHARTRDFFQASYLERLLSDPNGARDQRGGNALWAIAVLEMWLQQHCPKP